MIHKIIALLMVFYMDSVFAEGQVNLLAKMDPEKQMFKVFLMMVVFIILMVVAGILLKKAMGRLGIKTDKLKVIASIPLSSRERILLIQVGSKQYLLGATSYSIRTLCEVTENIQETSFSEDNSKFNQILKEVKLK